MKTFASFTAFALVIALGGTAFAQSAEGARSVGRKGATQLGIQFTTTTSLSTSGDGSVASTTNLFGGIDVGRFVTDKFLTRFGLSGFGQVGGQSFDFGDGSSSSGSNVSFNFLGGALFYLTPQKPQSFYIGGDISVPVSSSGTGNPNVNGRLGIQAAIRSNASLFVEGGYGATLSSNKGAAGSGGSSGSLQTNLGVRVLF